MELIKTALERFLPINIIGYYKTFSKFYDTLAESSFIPKSVREYVKKKKAALENKLSNIDKDVGNTIDKKRKEFVSRFQKEMKSYFDPLWNDKLKPFLDKVGATTLWNTVASYWEKLKKKIIS